MEKLKNITILLLCLSPFLLKATTLEVGPGYPYDNLEDAAQDASEGDTILFHQGTYEGNQYVNGLQGSEDNYIYILTAQNETVIIDSGTQAWHLPEANYLFISGFIYQHQSGNGINVDDGSSYETPAHHITFYKCTFQDMAATGNNDLLKMSGVDTFTIQECTFKNGSAGGSGIDFVGCHNGTITQCYFENMGSNAVQAKGGTQYITIHRNFFKNGGQRSINLGGSTGLDYFRPDTAHFEAADLYVFSNIFVGSYAPIAYVGCVDVLVINNTIYKPDHWVIRILQETVDPDRFYECGDNTFQNNIIYLGNSIATECNVGDSTRPETFTFSNNLWYHYENSSWNGPNLPVPDVNSIIQEDPLFVSPDNDTFNIPTTSPAAEAGFDVAEPALDYYGNKFADDRSIGAIEANPITSIYPQYPNTYGFNYPSISIVPIGKNNVIRILFKNQSEIPEKFVLEMFNLKGRLIASQAFDNPHNQITWHTNNLSKGLYLIRLKALHLEIVQSVFFF